MKKTALITGASSGIGWELALLHASKGDNLVLVARSKNKLDELKQTCESKHKVKVHTVALDLSLGNAAQQLFDELKQNSITVDYLINNAGFGDYGFFHESDWKKTEEMINVNITVLTHLTRLFLPDMVARKNGKILNVASTAAFQPGPTMAVYFATKAYVLHFSEAIANEVKPFGVTVTALCPGATQSGFQAAASMEKSKLFVGKKLPTAAQVAAYGYKAMMNGKTVAVHGFKNAIMAFSVRLAPRKLAAKIARNFQAQVN